MLTETKRGKGRPRKDIHFFDDPEANKKWNAERGKGGFRKSRYPEKMQLNGLKLQLCASWGVPITVSFDFVCALEYHQDDLPIELQTELECAQQKGRENRRKGGAIRAEAAMAEYENLVSNPKVRNVICTVAQGEKSVRWASQRLLANWFEWKLLGNKPSDRKLRSWIGAEANIVGKTSRSKN